MPYVRNHGFFQLFYWFHMLTIPFSLIMLLHGKNFYKWLIMPGMCYAIEKILRYRKIRSNKFGDTLITEAYVLPSKVVHLVIRKPPKFRFQPGDYVFVNIPVIAKYEWHPFSLSSAPEKSDYIWLHIRACGNWTRKLYSYASSPRFDMSNSFMQRSLTRVNMRAHMSKALTNESATTSVLKAKTCDTMCHLAVVDGSLPKKTVSFDKSSQMKKVSESEPLAKHSAQQQNSTEPNEQESNKQSHHKGILKVRYIFFY